MPARIPEAPRKATWRAPREAVREAALALTSVLAAFAGVAVFAVFAGGVAPTGVKG
ncbi:hypothetical protein ACF09K_06285 [Streptomyces sp. NPDC014882]|uniref:hypothetical protein n=1 Tax=Streptomyces sp. NPDC014882 TaxID=3364927 RepID=UPI003700D504